MERIETIIVGGGQAGLATSYHLAQRGREHIVLEQAARAGNVWRNERWDSFTLVTPNWALRMPGAEYDGPDRDAFMARDEIVAYFEDYVDRFQLPVQYNTRVETIEPLNGGGFRVATPGELFQTDHVVVATGYEQYPRLPSSAAGLSPEVMQLHSSRYRNPGSLPDGAVLVVGSAQSGCQIAEELHQAGREVYLSIGGSGRVPRRYRGRDMFAWLSQIGFFNVTPDKLPMPRNRFAAPHVSGSMGGHTLNLHQFARDGMTLLGHLQGGAGTTIRLKPDLYEVLTRVDFFESDVQKKIDGYIAAHGLEAPEEELPRLQDGYDQPVIEELDMEASGIHTIIWATGFTYDYGLVNMPVLDDTGFPIQRQGVSDWPGLYFAGMPWMPSLKTGILAGVGEAAEHVATHLAERSTRQPAA